MEAEIKLKNHIEKIQKRDERVVNFEQEKIINAIHKAVTAANQGDGEVSKKVSDQVIMLLNRRFKKGEIPTIEQIQDIVEETLISEDLAETAKAFILYREQRRAIRESARVVDESSEKIDSYLKEVDWQIKENANMTFSLQGLNQYVGSYISKKYWLNKIYPKEIRDAATNEDFHIHNLELLAPYCAGWDLYDFLVKGFRGVSGKIECRPPKHFRTALGQLVNVLFTLQGETAGANAVSNFDTLLAPFIRYNNLNYNQVKQSMQEFLYNCMVPTRVGFQTPFLNVSLDIKPPSFLASQPVIIGGEPKNETYGDFQPEMDMFIKAFYEGLMEGDASGRPFTFPIPTVSITKDFEWDNPNLSAMWEATAKYGINYFSNFVQSDMSPDDARSMCMSPNEEVLIRNSKKIKRLSIKEIADNYKIGDFDREGWAECEKERNLEVLSLNPQTLKTEWSSVERFFKVFAKESVEIETEDGKKATFSAKHPIPIYTEKGIEMKWSKDIEKGDYLLSIKKADEVLSKEYQKIDDFNFNENLASILGYFIADGNYLFENRKGYTHVGEPRGMQFTFKTGDKENLELVKNLIKKVFKSDCKEKQDPRYNTYYLYFYNTEISRKLYEAGFKKYGRLPQILFNSPVSVIKSFLEFHFKGDGYKKRGEIHINDLELSRDLALLYSLTGQPVTYKKRKNSQVIYLQHSKSKIKDNNGWLNNPMISERVPGWMAYSTYKVPGFVKSRMVGFDVLEKYNAQTPESFKIENSDIYLVRVKSVKKETSKQEREFYDLELSKNHLFLHSLGQISFNCCRLRLDNRELYKRGGGLFGSSPKTGSIGVVTINLPRLGYLSKTKTEFLERLSHLMDLAKESLEIKRKALDNFMEQGLYPYSKYYLEDMKKMRNTYFGNHFSTIGICGMNESLINFLNEDITTVRGRKFAVEILDFMRSKMIKFQEETGNLFNLEATPAEGTSYRQAKTDREKYPDIITAGTKEVPYYTNSSQLPVGFTEDIFEALNLQNELQTKYTGGCIEKGNKVLTNKGLLLIENIVKDFDKLKPIKVLSYNKDKKISEWDKILEAVKINVKKHDKIRVTGEKNLDIITSDWHPFFVLKRFKPNPACPICETETHSLKGFATHIRWNPECGEKYKDFPKYHVIEKRADELKEGDYILQNSYNLYTEKETKLDNDLMWLIGFFIGDGCISEYIDNRSGNNLKRNKVRFFSEHKEPLQKIIKILNKYFLANVNIIQNDKRSKKLLEISSSRKEVLDFFFEYGFWSGEKSSCIVIPKKVKENINKENVFSLLAGLADSDGHISKRDGDFEYYSISSKLVDDILEICSVAGIMFSKAIKNTKRKNESNIWRIRIPAYEITRLKHYLTNTVHISRIKENLSNRKKRYLPVIRVSKISKVDVKDNQFYDLMTENNHNYLAGKDSLVFVHNTVLHIFLGEKISDPDQAKNLVRKICDNYSLPYITLTPTFSICPTHGYLSGEHFECPQCTIKQPCEVYSRVVGYIRPVQQWHKGKQEEYKERKEFSFPTQISTEIPGKVEEKTTV